MAFKLLVSDDRGEVVEHPTLLATVRSGEMLSPAVGHPIPLPREGRLVHLPGRLPVGFDPSTGELTLVRELSTGSRTFGTLTSSSFSK